MCVCGCFLRSKQRYSIFQCFHKRKFNDRVHNNQNAQFDLLSVQSPTRQFRPRRQLGSNIGFNWQSSEDNCITCLLNLCHVKSRRFSLYIIIALLQNHILSTVILSISFTVVIQRTGKLHCIDSVDCRSLFRRSTIDRICKIAWFRSS